MYKALKNIFNIEGIHTVLRQMEVFNKFTSRISINKLPNATQNLNKIAHYLL